MGCDVLFVYPPNKLGVKPKFGFPPLGVLYLASFLEKKGVKVKVIDCEVKGHSLDKILGIVKQESPSILCLSIMTNQVISCLKIVEAAKKENDINVVVGGPHISSTLGEILEFTDAIDFLVYQEGENTLYELYSSLRKNGAISEVKGIIYKKNGEVVVTPPRDKIESLDELPFPNLELLDISEYDSSYAKSLPLTSMMCSRGCPFNCNFCDQYATHGKKLRLRSAKNVVDEIERNYRDLGIRQIMFKDSTFTLNKKWVKELCDEISNRGLKLNWTCNTRVDCFDEEIIKCLKSAGCYMVNFGIESASQDVLNNINKRINLQQVVEAVNLCKKHKVQVVGYFMIGNPGDTKKTVLKTIKFAKSLDFDLVSFGVTVAYPNTELFNWAVQHNVLSDKLWYMKDSSRDVVGARSILGNLNLEGFPLEEQIKMLKKANRSFYLRPKYIFRKLLSVGNPSELKRLIKSAKEILSG